jgi:hypothetical protein
VDDFVPNLSLVHSRIPMFPQVKGWFPQKEFLYPQSNPQSVHNVAALFHRLSTGVFRHLL